MKNKAVEKKEIVAEISYRIFDISSEGHLREPNASYCGDEYIFNDWNTYPSLEDARKAIEDYAKKKNNYFLSYVVLPLVTTREKSS